MFNEVLINLRKSKGLTQKELAKKIGMTASAIGNYEQGTRMPDYETLEIIADFFNVPLDSLFGKRKNNKTFISDDTLKFALFGDDEKITDTQLDNIKKYAQNLKKCNNIKNDLILSRHEEKVLLAYRSHPEMQEAVDRLLDIQETEKVTVFAAARSADSSYSAGDKEISKSVIEKLNKAPVTDDDL